MCDCNTCPSCTSRLFSTTCTCMPGQSNKNCPKHTLMHVYIYANELYYMDGGGYYHKSAIVNTDDEQLLNLCNRLGWTLVEDYLRMLIKAYKDIGKANNMNHIAFECLVTYVVFKILMQMHKVKNS